MKKVRVIFVLYTGLLVSVWGLTAQATTGYFALGYGTKSIGMAGATVAAPQDSMAAAVNPAGMALVGERTDLSFRAFNPMRESELDPRVFGGRFKVEEKSSRTWFFIPGGGLTRKINDQLWWGLSVYANGGLNTSYARNIYDETSAILGAAFAGGPAAAGSVPKGTGTGAPDTGRLGVDLGQVIFAPTLAFKINPYHSVGVSALLGVQYFEARGLGNFQCFTQSAVANNPGACPAPGPLAPGFVLSNDLTNHGHDWSVGAGVRLGWVGQLHPRLSLGASIASKIYMTRFDDYKELFAEDGDFDIPANFTVGIGLRPLDPVLLTFDFQRIFYSDVDSIANKGPVASAFGPTIAAGSGFLGRGNGLGFGWQDINVFRIGLQYQVSNAFTLSAGYSWNDSPIPNDQLLFNILSPAVITRHATFGLTYSSDDHGEWNLAYMHAFNESLSQATTALGVPGSIKMYQNSVELSYSWKY